MASEDAKATLFDKNLTEGLFSRAVRIVNHDEGYSIFSKQENDDSLEWIWKYKLGSSDEIAKTTFVNHEKVSSNIIEAKVIGSLDKQILINREDKNLVLYFFKDSAIYPNNLKMRGLTAILLRI